MSAELLRKAASLMRERAEAARPERGHWHVQQFLPEHREYEDEAQVMTDQKRETYGFVASKVFIDDAEHIASWHPAVALAVADWLDSPGCSCPPCSCCGVPQCDGTCEPREYALAVARAYLGADR